MRLKGLLREQTGALSLNLGASVLGLITFSFLARQLAVGEFGAYAVFLSASGLVDLIRTGLIRQGMVRLITLEKGESRTGIIGSAWSIHLVLIGILVLMTWALQIIIDLSLIRYYPLYLLATAPHQFSSWVFQGDQRFHKVPLPRLLVNILLIGLIVIIKPTSGEHAIQLLIIANGTISIGFSKSSGLQYLHQSSRIILSNLLHFGKYSLTTLAGANLLKSTDILLIGMFLGNEVAGIYAVPLKALEIVEIPMRTFAIRVFASLSSLQKNAQWETFLSLLWHHARFLVLLFSPLALGCLVFPGIVLEILGGTNQHATLILQILAISMFVMPVDKLLGIAFDSLGKPQINALKVWIMVVLNLAGDLVVLYVLGTPTWIALITVINVSVGFLFGIRILLRLPEFRNLSNNRLILSKNRKSTSPAQA